VSLLSFVTLRWDTTLGSSPLDEGSACHRDLYLTTHDIHQTAMPPPGFEPAIPASERPQSYALDRAAAWIGINVIIVSKLDRRPHCEGRKVAMWRRYLLYIRDITNCRLKFLLVRFIAAMNSVVSGRKIYDAEYPRRLGTLRKELLPPSICPGGGGRRLLPNFGSHLRHCMVS
jgi:hypothetical protein